MIRVLFICLGNICRSPMAEAVFRDLVKQENLSDKIEVDSAGLGHWHVGNPPHKGTRDILDRQRIPYDGMKARQVHTQDFGDFNYLIAMDDENISGLEEMDNKNADITVAKLMDFVDKAEDTNVPDPYFTGKFDGTYELVSKGCESLLNSIRNENNI
ncbi:low molecular weight protein-tyrosine-phosphatase [Lentibacillus sp. CBA3610]|uniref:low molecular weight protein-tyrosine-phosphatase n=1 Tax=Lentibacillus sp. CBA3610 TaxID=2518176 RepID=UPI0015956F41|nr:low molecular weight protein-tyrosine-phosphatase [Lentibacillus sp. CBA3610]QKY71535.1 low molecular weight phosphotyrosine protein phosphatase [Lentibacillus sp. CBA3610]